MNALGLAAPNGIRCQRAPVARPCRGSLRLRGLVVDIADRFWSKVDCRGPDECWPWVGSRNAAGYGILHVAGRNRMAHRLTFEAVKGPIPEGLQLDHLCRNPPCCNPAHLEAVTSRENTLRGNGPAAIAARATECRNGHPFDETNTWIKPSSGERVCRICKAARHAKWGQVRRPILVAARRAGAK